MRHLGFGKILKVKKFFKWMAALIVALAVLWLALPFALQPIALVIARSQLSKLDLLTDLKLKLRPCWTSTGPGIRGETRLDVLGTPWAVKARFMASPCHWQANAKLEETEFSNHDAAIAKLLADHPVTAVSNLTFSGKVSFEASAERTFRCPVPHWKAAVSLKSVSAAAISSEKPIELADANVRLGASGIADHVDIDPIFPRVRSLAYDNMIMNNLTASIRMTEKALLMNEASAGFWGGTVHLYSVFLDTKNLNTGLTLFLEDIDVCQSLSKFNWFTGNASGKLHGKIKLFLREGGKGLRLSDAFLYSTPGEIGKIQMADAQSAADGLALAGLDEESRMSVANALTDLDYTVLRLDLKRTSGEEAALGIRLEGSATRGELTVPVVLNITLHGAIEQLINTGLNLNNKKGKLK